MRQLGHIFILIVILNSCHQPCLFYDDIQEVTVEPTALELSGLYMADEKSKRLLKNKGFENDSLGRVIIKESGDFALFNAPETFAKGYGKKRVTTNGTWDVSFDKDYRTYDMYLTYDSLGPLKGRHSGQKIYKKKDTGKLTLFQFLGDPDECSCLMYERQ